MSLWLLTLLASDPLIAASQKTHEWVTQHAVTKRFSFAASCAANGDDYAVDAIRVKAQDKVVQTIALEVAGEGACEDVVGVRDVNFDDLPDLLIVAHGGGANVTYEVEVYDPARAMFVRDDTLSQLTQLTIDGPRSEIHSAFRDGAAHHTAKRYDYVGGQLTLLESIDRDCRSGDPCTVTTVRRSGASYKKSKVRKAVTAVFPEAAP